MKKLNKKKIIIALLLLIVLVPLTFTAARYISKIINDYYLESKHFYFSSDKLDEDRSNYRINNWSGVDTFTVDVELNSRKNELEVSPMDIDYELSYECDTGVTCTLSKTQGTIYSSSNSDSFSLKVNPEKKYETGDTISVLIIASSTKPYTKTISARFLITVGQEGINYEIADERSQAYFMMNISNTYSSYTVDTAFGSYSQGEQISADEYASLTDAEKQNCTCKTITLNFDPSKILLDTTNEITTNALETTTTEINGYEYIKSITFKIDALSSYAIRFYKKDKNQNYTYPFENNESIVGFEVR